MTPEECIRKYKKHCPDHEPCCGCGTKSVSILDEANSIIHGDRNESYGSYERECDRIAIGWTALLRDFLKDGVSIEPRFVPLMMVWLKASRDAHRPKRDNRRDGAGYWGLLEESYPAGDEQ